MTGRELLEELQALVDAGHGDEEVFLDVSTDGLLTIGEVGLDMDEVGIIIWKE